MKARSYVLSEDMAILREVSTKDYTWNYFSKTGLVFLRG